VAQLVALLVVLRLVVPVSSSFNICHTRRRLPTHRTALSRLTSIQIVTNILSSVVAVAVVVLMLLLVEAVVLVVM
jgi:hypothetical protein